METDKELMNNVKVTWRCPSNIAIVKYWGKKGTQIPCNSSLSLTLSNSFTEVKLELLKKGQFEDWLIDACINNIKLSEIRQLESNRSRSMKMVMAYLNLTHIFSKNLGRVLSSKKQRVSFRAFSRTCCLY